MRTVVVLVAVATLAWILVATHGGSENCHYNAHFAKRVICTEPAR
jgi:hypothetical protein